MNKVLADKTIEKYIYKIYGFSLTKTMNIDLAEELASNITFEVYKSFLKSEKITNIDGFVWKIACNLYSQFVTKEKNYRIVRSLPEEEKNEQDLEEQIERLRYEIAFLSKIQREVIVLHYFDKLKITEIAERLSLTLGTVKWHLHEARTSLKENYLDEDESKIKPQPPLFTDMTSLGYLGGWRIGMDYYFQRNFSQNIAYALYFKAKTSVEVAKELGVPEVFVDDEINHLCENGFVTKEPSSKYRTNFCIIKPANEDFDRVKRYAKIICDMYIPLFDIKTLSKHVGKTIYTPNNDLNFLMWSIITFACSRKLRTIDEREVWHKYFVKRKDGGEYIALAKIDDTKEPNKEGEYKKMDSISYCNPDVYPICYWQFHSKFDERKYCQETACFPLFETLYDFIKGKIPREPAQIDKYKPLFDNGMIISKRTEASSGTTLGGTEASSATTVGNTEIANIVISNLSLDKFEAMLPDIPDSLKSIGEELDEEIFQERKAIFASHIQDMGRALTLNSLAGSNIRIAVLEQLLHQNILKPIKKNQKLSVNTIMFCDLLPGIKSLSEIGTK